MMKITPESFIIGSLKCKRIIVTEDKTIYSDLIPLQSEVVKESDPLFHDEKGKEFINENY
jgi:hypothetical protein